MERLRRAIAESELGSAAELLAKLPDWAPKLDERTVRRYLAGETAISRGFLRAAAAALGKMPAWLEFGQEPEHAETAELLGRQGAFMFSGFDKGFHPYDVDSLVRLRLTPAQLDAVLAYSLTLHAAHGYDVETLVAAARFLVAAEKTIEELCGGELHGLARKLGGKAGALIRPDAGAMPGHYAAWAAALLAAFSMHVQGLGYP